MITVYSGVTLRDVDDIIVRSIRSDAEIRKIILSEREWSNFLTDLSETKATAYRKDYDITLTSIRFRNVLIIKETK